jgi:Ubiquitin fusion degradation protein UFD1
MASPSLNWSTQLAITSPSQTPSSLTGDKVLLPPSALQKLLDAAASLPSQAADDGAWGENVASRAQQQLPQPLTFRLYNPANNRFSHAVPLEFSAEEGTVSLSPFLREALGLLEEVQEAGEEGVEERKVTIVAKQLQRGTYVRLRPLEAGYDEEDWKALLERHLRMNYATLTVGEILSVGGRTVLGQDGGKKGGKSGGEFRFLIDKLEPEEAVCIVDTGKTYRTAICKAEC